MTFEEYWDALTTQRPIGTGKVLMSQEQLKKIQRQVWQIGYNHAKSQKSMFGEIFGIGD